MYTALYNCGLYVPVKMNPSTTDTRSEVPTDGRHSPLQTLKDLPHPQFVSALGLMNWKPPPINASLHARHSREHGVHSRSHITPTRSGMLGMT